MRLLKLLLIVVVGYYIFTKLNVILEERFLGQQIDCEMRDNPVGGSNDCYGNESHLGALTMCGWNNGVSTDVTMGRVWAPESLKGVERVYKYPNYYGNGTDQKFGYGYGQPFYIRTEDY